MSADLDAKVLEATGWSPLRKALHASRSGAAVKVIEFDGCGNRLRGVPLALRALTADESMRLRADALKWLTSACGFTEDYLIGTTGGNEALEFETKIRFVALALVEPAAPHAPVAKDADDLRTLLEADEVSALFELLVDWITERSPIASAKSAEEVAKLCDALGKGTMPLSRLSAFDNASLRTIASELVNRLRSQMSAPSSPTPPSSDTATESSEPSV